MAVLTDGFVCLVLPGITASDVLCLCHRLQVRRIHTETIATEMVELKAARDNPIESESMCQNTQA